jgi:hypothetical protein
MSDRFEGVRQMSRAVTGGIAEHLNAPPQRKNLNRASCGTGLLAGGIYFAYSYAHGISLTEAVHGYIGALHWPFEDSWPFYAWGGVMLFSLLWIMTGVRGLRGQPRDTMATFWSLAWIAGAGAALWNGWYLDDSPALNWFLRGAYIMALASSVMSLFLALRGPGLGAMHAVQSHIRSQMKLFRVGRTRRF